MKLDLDSQCGPAALSELATEAVALLSRGEFRTLADRFGYVLSDERDPEPAIRGALERALSEVGASSLAALPPEPIRVGYFEQNASSLLALVECSFLAGNSRSVLVELVVTGNDREAHLRLEEISAVLP